MTIRTVKDTPCWTLDHEQDWDWRPHYRTEAEALASLWDQRKEAREDELEPGDTMTDVRPDLVTSTPTCEPHRCEELVCDGCGLALGMEGELVDPGSGSHYLRGDLEAFECDTIRDQGWTLLGRHGHLCPSCTETAPADPPASDVGPFDEPLLGLDDDGRLQEVQP